MIHFFWITLLASWGLSKVLFKRFKRTSTAWGITNCFFYQSSISASLRSTVYGLRSAVYSHFFADFRLWHRIHRNNQLDKTISGTFKQFCLKHLHHKLQTHPSRDFLSFRFETSTPKCLKNQPMRKRVVAHQCYQTCLVCLLSASHLRCVWVANGINLLRDLLWTQLLEQVCEVYRICIEEIIGWNI